jgi:hypothetical protein
LTAAEICFDILESNGRATQRRTGKALEGKNGSAREIWTLREVRHPNAYVIVVELPLFYKYLYMSCNERHCWADFQRERKK